MKNQPFRLNERKLFMLVKRYCRELGWDRGEEIEICLAGQSTSGIDGDGGKWAPKLGETKNNKDAFIIIRKVQPVVSSEPMEEFKPQHEPETCTTTSTPSESTPSTESTPKEEKSSGAG